MRHAVCLAAAACLALAGPAMGAGADKLPQGFVYLRDVAPSIVQDMRYATANNFTGKPVPGYDAAECVLQRNAAEALKRAQEKAESLRFSLKVYDCYRPGPRRPRLPRLGGGPGGWAHEALLSPP